MHNITGNGGRKDHRILEGYKVGGGQDMVREL